MKKQYIFLELALILSLFSVSVNSFCLTDEQAVLVNQLAINSNLSTSETLGLFEYLCNKDSATISDIYNSLATLNLQTNTLSLDLQNLTEQFNEQNLNFTQYSLQINQSLTNFSNTLNNLTDYFNETYVHYDTFVQSNNVMGFRYSTLNESIWLAIDQYINDRLNNTNLSSSVSKDSFVDYQNQIDTRLRNLKQEAQYDTNKSINELQSSIKSDLMNLDIGTPTSIIVLLIISLLLSLISAGFALTGYSNKQNNKLVALKQRVKTGTVPERKTIYESVADREKRLTELRTVVLKDSTLNKDNNAINGLLSLINRGLIKDKVVLETKIEEAKLAIKSGINYLELIKSQQNNEI